MTDDGFKIVKRVIILLLLAVVGVAVWHQVAARSGHPEEVRDTLGHIGGVFLLEVKVPYWVLLILLLTGLPFWFGLLRKVREWRRRTADEELLAEHYLADQIQGVRWEWEFDGPGEVEDLHPVCPKCGARLTPRENAYTPLGPVTVVGCPPCDYTRDLRGKTRQVMADVRREIERKLADGTFRRAIRESREEVTKGRTAEEAGS